MVVQNQSQMREGLGIPTNPHHTHTFIQQSSQPQNTQKPRKPKRKETQVPQPSDPSDNLADEAIHEELGDSLVRDATTASSLEVEQNSDEEITLVSVHDVNVSTGEEVFTTIVDDITLAQVLEEMKSIKPKKKGIVIQELGESTTTISSQLSSQQSQDKGVLPDSTEPVKPMNKKDLIRLDEETALNLQAEFNEKERLAREKAKKEEEANIALIETWDDI
ncbi:hypothetical protein Tco_0558076 [Tanacetum coccineum]